MDMVIARRDLDLTRNHELENNIVIQTSSFVHDGNCGRSGREKTPGSQLGRILYCTLDSHDFIEV